MFNLKVLSALALSQRVSRERIESELGEGGREGGIEGGTESIVQNGFLDSNFRR